MCVCRGGSTNQQTNTIFEMKCLTIITPNVICVKFLNNNLRLIADIDGGARWENIQIHNKMAKEISLIFSVT